MDEGSDAATDDPKTGEKKKRVPSFSGPVHLLCIINLTNEQAMLSKTKMNGCCAASPSARQWK